MKPYARYAIIAVAVLFSCALLALKQPLPGCSAYMFPALYASVVLSAGILTFFDLISPSAMPGAYAAAAAARSASYLMVLLTMTAGENALFIWAANKAGTLPGFNALISAALFLAASSAWAFLYFRFFKPTSSLIAASVKLTMPGDRMVIDSEIHNGLISDGDGTIKREKITRSADFFASMDGVGKLNGFEFVYFLSVTLFAWSLLFLNDSSTSMDPGYSRHIEITLTGSMAALLMTVCHWETVYYTGKRL
jgi:hypothetical protein